MTCAAFRVGFLVLSVTCARALGCVEYGLVTVLLTCMCVAVVCVVAPHDVCARAYDACSRRFIVSVFVVLLWCRVYARVSMGDFPWLVVVFPVLCVFFEPWVARVSARVVQAIAVLALVAGTGGGGVCQHTLHVSAAVSLSLSLFLSGVCYVGNLHAPFRSSAVYAVVCCVVSALGDMYGDNVLCRVLYTGIFIVCVCSAVRAGSESPLQCYVRIVISVCAVCLLGELLGDLPGVFDAVLVLCVCVSAIARGGGL